MVKTALLAALTLATLTSTARADGHHAQRVDDRRAYYGLYEHNSATPEPAQAPPHPGEYGSFSAANTAHTFGY